MLFPSEVRGGVEEHSLIIATAAVKQGWEVHAGFPQTTGLTSLIRDFRINGVSYHQLEIAETDAYESKKTRLLRLGRVATLLYRVRPDVVLMALSAPGRCLESMLACRLLKIPAAVIFHSFPFPISFTRRRLQVYAWARTMKQQWIAVSDNTRKILCESFQIPQDEVIRIYNCAKVTHTLNGDNQENTLLLRRQVRQELGLSECCWVLLTVARLHPGKGYSNLLQTIPHIAKEFPNAIFVWAGEGEHKEHLLREIREYGVEDKVLLLDHRSDTPRLMKAADLFILPTHYEGLPLTLLEAMTYHLPVVISAVNGIPEVIQDKVHGLLCRAGDNCDLLETIRWALRHPTAMREMARNAQLRVRDFSEEGMVRETLDVLRRLGRIF